MNQLRRNGERGTVLLVAVIVCIMVIGFSGAYMGITKFQADETTSRIQRQVDFHIAEAGLDHARIVLRQDYDSGQTGWPSTALDPNTGVLIRVGANAVNFGSGSYTVRVTDNNDGDGFCPDADRTLLVTSEATCNGINTRLRAVVYLEAMPTTIMGALTTGKDLKINGNPSIIGAGGSAHSNGDLDAVGNPSVDQSVTCSGNLTIHGTPNIGGAQAGGQDEITIPNVDPLTFKDQCDWWFTSTGQVYKNGVLWPAGASGWDFQAGKWKATNDIAQSGGLFFETEVLISGNLGSAPSGPHAVVPMVACGTCGATGKVTCNPCTGTGSTLCGICNGAGSVSCAVCGGSGNANCNVCNGSGIFIGNAPCGVCGGDGLVSSSCGNCGGDGRVNGTCAVCNGTRRNPPNCTFCSGTGTKPNGQPCNKCAVCAPCGGDGIVEIGCATCGGDGLVNSNCGNCGGDGLIPSNGPCANCGGDGLRSCGDCGGDGSASCLTCAGNGRVVHPDCAGTGQITCTVCGGSGQVADIPGWSASIFAVGDVHVTGTVDFRPYLANGVAIVTGGNLHIGGNVQSTGQFEGLFCAAGTLKLNGTVDMLGAFIIEQRTDQDFVHMNGNASITYNGGLENPWPGVWPYLQIKEMHQEVR